MPIKVKGSIPSIAETAAEVGVSAKRAAELARFADNTASVSSRSLAPRSDLAPELHGDFWMCFPHWPSPKSRKTVYSFYPALVASCESIERPELVAI